ncbi:MAG: C40 family peptidase [Janthinobacterium lividum]
MKALQGKVGLERTGKTSRAVRAVLQDGGRKVPAPRSSSGGAEALAFAKKQLGDRYEYGAAGPGRWDCSGLSVKAWAAAGTKLPHSSKAQSWIGEKVKKSDLRPGDLVFLCSGPSHVGIYAGGGKVIHAPKPAVEGGLHQDDVHTVLGCPSPRPRGPGRVVG